MPESSRAIAAIAADPNVRLAAERTMLAWIRTGLAMMGFGFVVARFGIFLREVAAAEVHAPPTTVGYSQWIGTALIVLGVLVNVLAAAGHYRFLSRLKRGELDEVSTWTLSMVVSLIVAAFGLGMAAYLTSVAR